MTIRSDDVVQLEREIIAFELAVQKAQEQGLPIDLLCVMADRKRAELRDYIGEAAG